MAATPELLLPADAATIRLQSAEFSWEPVDGGADRYTLQIALDEAFSQLVSETDSIITRVEKTFPSGQLYYWRVRAQVGVSTLTSTTVRHFSAPPFIPAQQADHVAAGKGRLLNQFREDV